MSSSSPGLVVPGDEAGEGKAVVPVPQPQLTQPARTRVWILTLQGQAQPLLRELLHRGQMQLSLVLYPRQARPSVVGRSIPQYKDISCLFLGPIKFLQKKTPLQLHVFSLIFGRLSTKSQTVAELLLEGGEPILNVLEVSTRHWQNHSKASMELGSLLWSGCSCLFLQAVLMEAGEQGEGGREQRSLASSPVPWGQRRDGEGFT